MPQLIELQDLDHPLLTPYRDVRRVKWSMRHDRFIAEGRFVVERLIASPMEIESIVVGDHVSPTFLERVGDDTTILRLPRLMVSQLLGFEFHSGIVACGRRRRITHVDQIASSLCQSRATVVVCPYTVLADNLGGIVRICRAFGVAALLVGHRSAVPFSRRAIRVSMGNIFELPVVETEEMESCLATLVGKFDFEILAATGARGADPLPFPRPSDRLALMLGNEAEGIPDDLLSYCSQQVTIPMSGGTDSLNVAHAAAIMLYQFTRLV